MTGPGGASVTPEQREYLRRFYAPGGSMPDDYERGYRHALDDVFRWLVLDGMPPCPPNALTTTLRRGDPEASGGAR